MHAIYATAQGCVPIVVGRRAPAQRICPNAPVCTHTTPHMCVCLSHYSPGMRAHCCGASCTCPMHDALIHKFVPTQPLTYSCYNPGMRAHCCGASCTCPMHLSLCTSVSVFTHTTPHMCVCVCAIILQSRDACPLLWGLMHLPMSQGC